ncbi:hypothetical protein A4R44_08840 [Amycolatopsis sp. M39]|nr:hypothetical protein A4R44_08840 [Amycolatopsis sp. M39]
MQVLCIRCGMHPAERLREQFEVARAWLPVAEVFEGEAVRIRCPQGGHPDLALQIREPFAMRRRLGGAAGILVPLGVHRAGHGRTAFT